MRYKFRSECLWDIICFITVNKQEQDCSSKLQLIILSIQKDDILPDYECVFESKNTKLEIINKMLKLDDSHVMYQTLELEKKYTGERNYEL
jgi:hypothetical protein